MILRRVFATAMWDASDTDTVVDVDNTSVAGSDASYYYTPTALTVSESSVTLAYTPIS